MDTMINKKAAGINTHRFIKKVIIILIPDIHFLNQVVGTTHFIYQK